jgi:hypothetical protein
MKCANLSPNALFVCPLGDSKTLPALFPLYPAATCDRRCNVANLRRLSVRLGAVLHGVLTLRAVGRLHIRHSSCGAQDENRIRGTTVQKGCVNDV